MRYHLFWLIMMLLLTTVSNKPNLITNAQEQSWIQISCFTQNKLSLDYLGLSFRVYENNSVLLIGSTQFEAMIESRRERIVLTRLQQKSNVPFDRLKTYLNELKERGLIEDETAPRLTDKGRQSLAEYEQVLEFMKRLGLAYRR
jgi:predicted transcriptional regulator